MARSADPKTLAQQLGALARLPVTLAVEIRRSRLHWRAELQPTPLSRTYSVGLAYAFGGGAPRVEVLTPQLKEEGVSRLPHVLSGDALCLCYPWQWDDGKLIARTIVPWASEWLLHFELWKVDRIWHGGGHEPAPAEAAL
ncbi:MAG: hypothetical protein QOI84_824 [Solirubrobacterales bacterium]|jgi:hypothetical protein|nr:hypothetical protein [Solirubrobacterales bacterium]